MFCSRSLFASTAISLTMMANAAYADLTAAQVWGDWKSYMEGMGYTVTATEAANGDTLAVSGVSVEIDGGPDIEKMRIGMGAVELVGNSNGTVDVVMPDVMPIIVEIDPKSTDKPAKFELAYTQSGQKMTVSGDPAAMAYDYEADTFSLALTSVLVDGTVMDQNAARFSLAGTGVQSQTTVTVGETRNYAQTAQIGSVVYDLFFKDPNAVEAVNLNSTTQSVAFTGTSVVPVDQALQMEDFIPMLAAGFAFDGAFTTQGTETKMEITSDDGTTKIKTGSANATLAVAMGAEGINYNVAAEQVQVGGQLAGLPFPLFAEMEKTGFSLRAPVLKSDTPQDVKLAFNATGFTMSDIIWALFDPSSQLPRDPATIALDVSGKAKVLLDSVDPAAMQAMVESDGKPGELHALTINRLTVDAVGAKLDATGDFVFDNTDKTTLPGFPKPVGAVNINLTGANGLIDKLIAMGFLPAEQAMGARMMMGMFAVPGDAPDTLKSKIKFNEAGQILANGQRLK